MPKKKNATAPAQPTAEQFQTWELQTLEWVNRIRDALLLNPLDTLPAIVKNPTTKVFQHDPIWYSFPRVQQTGKAYLSFKYKADAQEVRRALQQPANDYLPPEAISYPDFVSKFVSAWDEGAYPHLKLDTDPRQNPQPVAAPAPEPAATAPVPESAPPTPPVPESAPPTPPAKSKGRGRGKKAAAPATPTVDEPIVETPLNIGDFFNHDGRRFRIISARVSFVTGKWEVTADDLGYMTPGGKCYMGRIFSDFEKETGLKLNAEAIVAHNRAAEESTATVSVSAPTEVTPDLATEIVNTLVGTPVSDISISQPSAPASEPAFIDSHIIVAGVTAPPALTHQDVIKAFQAGGRSAKLPKVSNRPTGETPISDETPPPPIPAPTPTRPDFSVLTAFLEYMSDVIDVDWSELFEMAQRDLNDPVLPAKWQPAVGHFVDWVEAKFEYVEDTQQ